MCTIPENTSMLASVELKKREIRDDLDFLQMNGYIHFGIFFYQKQAQGLVRDSTAV
jgi:hypothetical protein